MLSYQLASSSRHIFLAGEFIRDFIVANLVHEDMDADLYVLDDASGASSVSEYLNEASRFAASLCLQFPEGWDGLGRDLGSNVAELRFVTLNSSQCIRPQRC